MTETESSTPEQSEQEKNQRRLIDFIESKGGSITFEEFMYESLYGEGGYYQEKVQIGKKSEGADFMTYAESKMTAYLLQSYIQERMQENPDEYRFVELAGGMGTLKKNILAFAESAGQSVPYLNVDISEKLSRLQHEAGGEGTVRASALELPFPDESITGTLFSNELVDALPFRVVQVFVERETEFSMRSNVSIKELHYTVKDGTVTAEWRDPSPEVLEYWETQQAYLRERGLPPDQAFQNGQVVTMNLYESKLVEEFDRVLKQGEIIMIDYGDHFDNMTKDGSATPRLYPRKHNSLAVEEYPNIAYDADITADVNFTVLIQTAKKLGLQVELLPQFEFFLRLVTNEDAEKYRTSEGFKKWFNELRDSGTDPLKKRGSFKVLIIKKEQVNN